MLAAIKQQFPRCETHGCLSSVQDETILIFENEVDKRCYVQQPSENTVVHLTIRNPTAKPLHFLAIDQCLFSDTDAERCDCALFDETKILFAELKVGGKRKNRKKLVKKAKDQLESTIRIFDEKIDLSGVEKVAIINVGYSQARPQLQTSIQRERIRFQTELDTHFDIAEEATF